MRRILKSKRGAALEGALLFMMVVFMLAMLLTSVVLNAHLRVRVNDKAIENEMILDYVGEQFVNGKIQENGIYYGCTAEIKDENTTLTLTKGNKVLSIKIKDGKVVEWIYSAK